MEELLNIYIIINMFSAKSFKKMLVNPVFNVIYLYEGHLIIKRDYFKKNSSHFLFYLYIDVNYIV